MIRIETSARQYCQGTHPLFLKILASFHSCHCAGSFLGKNMAPWVSFLAGILRTLKQYKTKRPLGRKSLDPHVAGKRNLQLCTTTIVDG